MIILLALITVLRPDTGITRLKSQPVKKEIIFTPPHIGNIPQFPGGLPALQRFIADHAKYPADAEVRQVQGTVIIGFTVAFNGKVTRIHSVGAPVDTSLEKEAIRVVKLIPDWKPYKSFEGAGPMQMELPVKFTLPKKK